MKKLLLLVVINLSLFAHPHTFIDIFIKVNSHENIIQSIDFKWKIDDMTSSMLLMEFDQNGDNKIDKEEDKFINENYFAPLKSYGFFTNLIIKDKPTAILPSKYFTTIEDGRICHNFTIVLNEKAKDINIEFFDEEFLVAMILKKDFIDSQIDFQINEIDNEFYFGYGIKF